MKIKKSVLLDALKVLGKVVSQTSPVEVQRSVRFLGVGEQVWLDCDRRCGIRHGRSGRRCRGHGGFCGRI